MSATILMKDTSPMKHEMVSETRRSIIKWIIQAILGWIGYVGTIILASGRLEWIWGWALLIVVGAFLAAHPLILIPINPELLAEREKGTQDKAVKTWDKWITAFAAGVFPITS
jgi:hypothetical protein